APVHAGSRRIDALSPHLERMIEDDKQGSSSSQRLNGKEACRARGLALGSRKTHGSIASIWPPAAQSKTTSQGGVCHINSSRNASLPTHPDGTISTCSNGRTTWPPPNTSEPTR